MSEMEKSLLLLCYYFPPAPMALSQRVAKLCKYLPRETGWTPQVICGELTPDVPGLDNFLLSEIPEVVGVERVGSHLSSNLARTLRAWHLEKPIRLWRKLTVHPDAYGDWIDAAVAAAEKKFPGGKGFKVILASGPPNSAYVAGALLKAKWNIPLVVDMRDPWCQRYGKMPYLIRWVDNQTQRLEENIYRQTDMVIANTKGNMLDLQQRFPELSTRLTVIPNGYDIEDLDCNCGPRLCQPDDASDILNLLYLGGVRGTGFEEAFFQVLEAYLKDYPDERHKLRIHFVGAMESQIKQLVSPFGLEDVCRAHGVVPGNAVGRPLSEADIYLLLLPPQISYDGVVPSKVYYYLAGGKYIFALIPDGSARQIVSQAGDLAEISSPDDLEGAKAALKRIIVKARQSKIAPPGKNLPSYSLPFDRRRIARQVGEVLDSVVTAWK